MHPVSELNTTTHSSAPSHILYVSFISVSLSAWFPFIADRLQEVSCFSVRHIPYSTMQDDISEIAYLKEPADPENVLKAWDNIHRPRLQRRTEAQKKSKDLSRPLDTRDDSAVYYASSMAFRDAAENGTTVDNPGTYDRTRVKVDQKGTYLDASVVRGPDLGEVYIVAKTPSASTA